MITIVYTERMLELSANVSEGVGVTYVCAYYCGQCYSNEVGASQLAEACRMHGSQILA